MPTPQQTLAALKQSADALIEQFMTGHEPSEHPYDDYYDAYDGPTQYELSERIQEMIQIAYDAGRHAERRARTETQRSGW